MRKLILIRHAQTRPDPDVSTERWRLSAAGRENAARFASHLEPYLPGVLLTSTEKKARETAEIIGIQLGLAVFEAPGFHEHGRKSTPFFRTQAEFKAAVAEFFDKPGELVLGDETALQALKRFELAVQRTLASYPSGNVMVVSHGTVISLFVAKYNAVEVGSFWEQLKMPDRVVLSFVDFRLLQSAMGSMG